MKNVTERFSDRADDYALARPSYPDALYGALLRRLDAHVVADVGSGTGISSAPLLARGLTVIGVEPNAAMRAEAERRFANEPRFTSVAGTAESTTLGDASVDLVTIAQAFHWMDPDAVRRECMRILRPNGVVALYWNWKHTSGTRFLAGYEDLLRGWGTDYLKVKEGYRVTERLDAFFGGEFEHHVFVHSMMLDRDALRALLLSSSYVPGPDDLRRFPMLAALDYLFDATSVDGRVEMYYDAELFVGRLRD